MISASRPLLSTLVQITKRSRRPNQVGLGVCILRWSRHATFRLSGASRPLFHEAGSRMASLGHQITVLTTDPRGGALPVAETVCGMHIRRVRAWPRNRDYYFAPRIYAEIARGQWDIVHIQGYNTFVAPIAMFAAMRRGIPFVLTFHSGGHSSRLRNAIRGLQHALLAPLAARARRLIGVSGYEAAFFSNRMGVNPSRFTVVPNGASLPPPTTAPLTTDRNLVVSIGRWNATKVTSEQLQPSRICDSARAGRAFNDPRFRLYEPELRSLIRSLGLEERITIDSIPSAERQRLSDLLCSAGLVILLSDYEAHPVAVMEALSLRRSVLVTDTSGLRELAEKGLCRSVPLNATPSMIAGAIARNSMRRARSRRCDYLIGTTAPGN